MKMGGEKEGEEGDWEGWEREGDRERERPEEAGEEELRLRGWENWNMEAAGFLYHSKYDLLLLLLLE